VLLKKEIRTRVFPSHHNKKKATARATVE